VQQNESEARPTVPDAEVAAPPAEPGAIPEEDWGLADVIQFAEADTGPRVVRSMLTIIAILTDQGAALAAFVKHFHFNWKLCIRHILEAVGSKDPIFTFVLRLIYCWCPEEYVHTCQTIAIELQQSGFQPRKAAILQLMMGIVHVQHPLKCLSRWAAFARKGGIPRLSNSIEGRHSHLNRQSKVLKELLDLIVRLLEHRQTAYHKLNANLKATLKRNWRHVFPSEEDQNAVSFNQAKWAYYRALHTLRGRKEPSLNAQLKLDGRYDFPPDYRADKVDVYLPSKWQPKPQASSTETPEKQTLHACGIDTARDWLAWRIMADLRRERDPDLWNTIDTSAFASIVRLGSRLPANGPFSPRQGA
jgi:hypothetical protein